MDTGTHLENTPEKQALRLAISKAGGQSALGRGISRKQSTVWEWLHVSGRVGAEDAIAIERVTGVPSERLCPALAEYARLRGVPVRAAA